MSKPLRITSLRDGSLSLFLMMASKEVIPHLVLSLNLEINFSWLLKARKAMKRAGIVRVRLLEISKTNHIHIFRNIRCLEIKINIYAFVRLDSKAQYFVTNHSQCEKVLIEVIDCSSREYYSIKSGLIALKKGAGKIIVRQINLPYHEKDIFDCVKNFNAVEKLFLPDNNLRPIKYTPMLFGVKYVTLSYFKGIKNCLRMFTGCIFVLQVTKYLDCLLKEKFLLLPYIRHKGSLLRLIKKSKSSQIKRTILGFYYKNRTTLKVPDSFKRLFSKPYQIAVLFQESCIDFDDSNWIID